MEENPAFGPQRCAHCGLNMMSDQQQAIREQKIKPLAEKLDEQLLFVRAGKDQAVAVSYAQELYNSLLVYQEKAEFDFLQPLLNQAKEELAPFPQKQAPQQQKYFSWVVLVILFIIPVFAFIIYENPILTLLLSLTFVAWLLIAVLPMMKAKKELNKR